MVLNQPLLPVALHGTMHVRSFCTQQSLFENHCYVINLVLDHSDSSSRAMTIMMMCKDLQAAAASRGPALPPAISPQNGAAADDSGTDTDDDGNLIAQARLAREAALQKKIAPKRAPAGELHAASHASTVLPTCHRTSMQRHAIVVNGQRCVSQCHCRS